VAEQPLLSLIITSYSTQRIKDIFELLDSIKDQTYSKIENIIVVERSKELLEQVKSYVSTKSISNVIVVFNDGVPGLSAARNLGIEHAKGKIIGFVDDDVILFPDWGEETVKAFEDESVIGVTGPALPLWEQDGMSWFPEEFYWILSCTAWFNCDELKDVRNAWGMNMAFRREAFDLGERFSPKFGLCSSSRIGWCDPPSEDVDLSLRVKRRTAKRIIYNPYMRVNHKVHGHRLTQKFITQRAYSVGYQRRMLKQLYNECDKDKAFLNQEHQLLKRILTKLLPSLLKDLFRNPVVAWRRFQTSVTVLLFVALGYYSHLLPILKSGIQPISIKESGVSE
jgi:glycosyltransferase involved in cell wall biosynthesis